jgi:hypothetical protein
MNKKWKNARVGYTLASPVVICAMWFAVTRIGGDLGQALLWLIFLLYFATLIFIEANAGRHKNAQKVT